MNSETWAVVEDITTRVQRALRAGDHPAIVDLKATGRLPSVTTTTWSAGRLVPHLRRLALL